MRKSIWKSKAYKKTKVNYAKSQMKINKLLADNGIVDSQHSNFQGKAQIVFIKELEVENKNMKVGVKISIPDVTEKNRNQLYRALFYYLKAKFESLTFGFVEEYNEAFVKEFMPYLIADRQGRTVADIILPKLNNAIGQTKQGEQLYLEDKNLEKDGQRIKETIKYNARWICFGCNSQWENHGDDAKCGNCGKERKLAGLGDVN